MRVPALEFFAALAQQSLASLATNAPAIGIYGLLFPILTTPALASALRLRAIGPKSRLYQITHHFFAVVTLVGDNLARPFRIHALARFFAVGFRCGFCNPLAGFGNRLHDGRRIAFISRLQRDRHDRTRLHVHGVLGLVGQMRAPVFHLRDAGIRVLRMLPFVVRPLLLPLPVQLGQLLPRRRLDPALVCQTCQKLVVLFPCVTPHNRTQRCIGFQCRRIHPDRMALQQIPFRQNLQHPLEHRLVRLHVHQSSRSRDRRMVWNAFIQRDPHKRPDRQTVAGPPGDAALRIDALEVADHQQTKIDARRQSGPSHRLGIEPLAHPFDNFVEMPLIQKLIQLLVKRMARRYGQRLRRRPQLLLSYPLSPSAHCHFHIDVRNTSYVTCFAPDLHHALLVSDELTRRSDRLLERRRKQAGFRDPHKSLDNFDFTFNPKMNRSLVFDLATAAFVSKREDALVLGPAATGKSHPAQATGQAAIVQNYRVMYRETHVLLDNLAEAVVEGTRKQFMESVASVPLLIIDDFGMRKLPHTAAEDLLEIIMRRYERASTLLTSNRPVEDWGKLLGDVAAVSAMLDRLLHHGPVLKCGPRSWRTKTAAEI